MSRIGKQPIPIPKGTDVSVAHDAVIVKGPKGELSRTFRGDISIRVEGDSVVLQRAREVRGVNALWGTYASHIKNMIDGVNSSYEKKLVVEGVGYRAHAGGGRLVLQVGFSHPVEIEIPEGLVVTAENNVITVGGIDKEAVGHFAALVRDTKKPEPYKGKGIRYEGEVIRRKQGKKAA